MANFMYTRNSYLNRIRGFLGKPVVKVITGMRRVGKSTLLRQIIESLHEDGVADDRILYVDMESLDFEHIASYRELQAEAERSLLKQPGMKYLLVDEDRTKLSAVFSRGPRRPSRAAIRPQG